MSVLGADHGVGNERPPETRVIDRRLFGGSAFAWARVTLGGGVDLAGQAL